MESFENCINEIHSYEICISRELPVFADKFFIGVTKPPEAMVTAVNMDLDI